MKIVRLFTYLVMAWSSIAFAQTPASPQPTMPAKRAVPSPTEYPFAQIQRGLETGSAAGTNQTHQPLVNSVITDEQVPIAFVPQGDVPLTPTGADAVKASTSIVHTRNTPEPSSDGRVVYTYGVGLPEIICAPFRVCTLELQAGEKITGEPQIGDSTRWFVTPTSSGSEGFEIPILVIKPTAPGLDTSMVVTTDRRTYYVRLISKPEEFVARTSFAYSDDEHVQWKMFLAQQEKDRQERLAKDHIATTTHAGIEGMYFDYEIEGKKKFFAKNSALKPVRVMDDGEKTYIEMPQAALHRELPVLVIIGPTGASEMVNYRVKGNMYVVDRLFDKASILLGSGKQQVYFWIVRGRPVGAGLAPTTTPTDNTKG